MPTNLARLRHLVSAMSDDDARTGYMESTIVMLIGIHCALVVINEHSEIMFCNPMACGIFGYGEQEMRARRLTDLMPERYREKHERAIADVVTSGKMRYDGRMLRVMGRRKDGEEFPAELRLSGLICAKGHWQFAGVITDLAAPTEEVLDVS